MDLSHIFAGAVGGAATHLAPIVWREIRDFRLERLVRRLRHEGETRTQRIKRLESLVGHCWVHSGYPDCGFNKMDSDQRILYLELTCRKEEAEELARDVARERLGLEDVE